MRKIVLLLCLMAVITVKAQTNPQPGYIITNENDTIRGIVNYLSDLRNMRGCHFRADGAEDFQNARGVRNNV